MPLELLIRCPYGVSPWQAFLRLDRRWHGWTCKQRSISQIRPSDYGQMDLDGWIYIPIRNGKAYRRVCVIWFDPAKGTVCGVYV